MEESSLEYLDQEKNEDCDSSTDSANKSTIGKQSAEDMILERERERARAYMRYYRRRKRQQMLAAEQQDLTEANRPSTISEKEEYITQDQSIPLPKTPSKAQTLDDLEKRRRRAEYMKLYRRRRRERLNKPNQGPEESNSVHEVGQHNELDLERPCTTEAHDLVSKYETEEYVTQEQIIPSPTTLDSCPYTPDVEIKDLCSENSFGHSQAPNDLAAILIRLEAKIDSIADDVKTLKEIACQHATTLDAITKSSNAEPQDVKPFASNFFKP